VVLTKARRAERDEPFKTFEEWDPEADRQAYANL
jgi:hypothetical protein